MGEYNSINQNFDSRPSYAVIKSKVGQQDVFLQKFNSDNILEWVVTAGSSSIDLASDVVVDSDKNVYVTGVFRNSVDFDPDPIQTDNQSSNGRTDVFVWKLDSNGKYLWVNLEVLMKMR